MMARSLFTPVVPPEKEHPFFREVRTSTTYTPARRLMDDIFAEFVDVDKSFIREFQTAGFSPRLFELALFGYFQEQDYDLDRKSPTPDFVYRGEKPFAVEVTTTNPPQEAAGKDSPSPRDIPLVPDDLPESTRAFVFQIGKALRRKLTKRDKDDKAYWEQHGNTGIPFVIAVEAFHDAYAQMHALGSVGEYLYGRRDIVEYDEFGNLTLTAAKVENHHLGDKTIPSGLFGQPEAKNL